MTNESTVTRRCMSAALSILAVLLAVTCVVLAFTGQQLAVAAGSGSLLATGVAGVVHVESKWAPAAFLLCAVVIVVAVITAWVRA